MAFSIVNIPVEKIAIGLSGGFSLKLVTDAVAAINAQVNNGNQTSSGGTPTLTITSGAAGTAFPNQEYVDVIGGAIGGGDLFQQVQGPNTASTILLQAFPFNTAIAAGSEKTCTLLYRISTKVKAKKVILTDLTNLIKWETNDQMDQGSALKTANTGALSLVTKGIYIFPGYIVIHPNLMPVSSNFTLDVQY